MADRPLVGRVEAERAVVVGRDNTGTINLGPVYQGVGLDSQQRRNRQAMLRKVHTFWVRGVLEKSLQGAALQALGLEDRPEAVPQRGDLVVRELPEPDQPVRTRPPGTAIVEVFDEFEGRLLILGAPGAGKTTLLLDLARTLLARAEQDETLPMPVMFPLSGWAARRAPLAEWLVDALNERYDVPKPLGRTWVEQDALLPLLDGLDEVAPAHRAACVGAINAFQESRRRALPSLAVCSRVAAYEALSAQLNLKGAVVVQPLTPRQIDAYLESAGPQLAGVRAALAGDATLRELAASPLMLSVISLAYQGRPAEALAGSPSGEARRTELFASYVERMFTRRGAGVRYPNDRTLRWLAWLAGAMIRQDETVFYLERLQPEWLPTRALRWRYALIRGLLVGLAGGLAAGLGAGLLFGLGVGLASGSTGRITMVETINWSFSKALRGLLFGLAAGLAVGLLAGLGAGLLFGLGAGLGVGLLAGLVPGEVAERTVPNQGIRRSAVAAVAVGLAAGLAGGLATGLAVGLDVGLAAGLDVGLLVGLGGGLLVGLAYGGYACLSHVTLRFVLWRSGAMPWDYVRFLDYAAERILLRKVGGGYIFVHRLLLEHFAALDGVSPIALGTPAAGSSDGPGPS